MDSTWNKSVPHGFHVECGGMVKYWSICSFRIVGDGGNGVDVGDSHLEVSRGEAFSMVIGIVAGEFLNESSL